MRMIKNLFKKEKTWRINKKSMSNEDVYEEIMRERVLKLLEEEIRRINDSKLYKGKILVWQLQKKKNTPL